MPGREEAKDSKRLRILAAAYAECERVGVARARMQDVATRAQVSKGTLYNYFESKQHLFLSTVLQSHLDSERRLDAPPNPSADPLTQLDHLLGSMAAVLEAISGDMAVNLQVWGVLVRDPEGRERLLQELHRIYAGRADSIRETLAEGQARGVFRADLDFDTVAAGVIAIFDGFVYRSVFDPARANPAALRRCFDALIRDAVVVGESANTAGASDA